MKGKVNVKEFPMCPLADRKQNLWLKLKWRILSKIKKKVSIGKVRVKSQLGFVQQWKQ